MKELFNRKTFILFLLFYPLFHLGYSSDERDNSVAIVIDKYREMTPEELLKSGDSFLNRSMNDSAMTCYSLIYNNRAMQQNSQSQQIMCKALNRASKICYYHCDYKLSLELLLKALEICENINYDEYIGQIYNNIGNIHYQFKDYKSARRYYGLAYKKSTDSAFLGSVFNNLGMLAHEENMLDSALQLYKKAYTIKNGINDSAYNATVNNIALICQSLKIYDSAFFYHNIALKGARKFRLESEEAMILSNMGQLHFSINNMDSAICYLKLSNEIAERLTLFNILSSNYLSFSNIEEGRGDINKSFDYYKKYSKIKDSLFNVSAYGTISELQSIYEMRKVDKQIKELNIEQEIKERTIVMQRRLQFVMGLILLVVIIFLALLYIKNRTLNRAYNVLASKNMEIVKSDRLNEELRNEYEAKLKAKDEIIASCFLRVGNEEQETIIVGSPKASRAHKIASPQKYQSSSLKDEYRDELVSQILSIMDDKELFCDVDFSVDKLSKMIGSNPTYVSQIINETFKKNFRSFIDEYRIKEARRLLSSADYQKYSIESIGTMVGFKSRRSFDTIFKEVTGISPSFYIKSQMQ